MQVMKSAVSVLVLLVFSITASGCLHQNKTIEAESLSIKDSKGRVRISLTVDADQPLIRMYKPDGTTPLVDLAATADGGFELRTDCMTVSNPSDVERMTSSPDFVEPMDVILHRIVESAFVGPPMRGYCIYIDSYGARIMASHSGEKNRGFYGVVDVGTRSNWSLDVSNARFVHDGGRDSFECVDVFESAGRDMYDHIDGFELEFYGVAFTDVTFVFRMNSVPIAIWHNGEVTLVGEQ